jgi:hypothetical protein
VWRSLGYCIKAGASDGDVLITQDIAISVLTEPYTPWWPMVPLFIETGWTGDVTIGWGDSTQSFTESDLTEGAWVQIGPDRDADLYPANFHQASSKWSLRLETDNAVTAEIVCGGFYPIKGVQFNDVWYFHGSHSSYPVLLASLTMADTSTHAGIIQDILSFVYGYDGVGAYLCTGGTNTLADPS